MPLIKAAIEHQGAAFIDVISPCVAFNNHAGSTKSFDYVREHNEAVNLLDFITGRAPIHVDYAPGTVEMVEQHDGTMLALRKLNAEYDVHDRLAAMSFLQQHAAKGQIVTGLLYVERRSRGPARPSQHRRGAAQYARREGAVPRLGGAGKDQRQPALIGIRFSALSSFLIASIISVGGSILIAGALPVSSRLLRLDRIAGQPDAAAGQDRVGHVPRMRFRHGQPHRLAGLARSRR